MTNFQYTKNVSFNSLINNVKLPTLYLKLHQIHPCRSILPYIANCSFAQRVGKRALAGWSEGRYGRSGCEARNQNSRKRELKRLTLAGGRLQPYRRAVTWAELQVTCCHLGAIREGGRELFRRNTFLLWSSSLFKSRTDSPQF